MWLKRSNFVLVDADANTLLSIQVRIAVATAMNGTIAMTLIGRRKNDARANWFQAQKAFLETMSACSTVKNADTSSFIASKGRSTEKL